MSTKAGAIQADHPITPVSDYQVTVEANHVVYIGSYWLEIKKSAEVIKSIFPQDSAFRKVITTNFALTVNNDLDRDRKILEKLNPDLMTMTLDDQAPVANSGHEGRVLGEYKDVKYCARRLEFDPLCDMRNNSQ